MGNRDRLGSFVNRRGFIGLVGKGAAVVVLGGVFRFLGRQDAFIRPPKARPEDEFLSLCIRCDKCRLACPWDLITPVAITESIVSAGTPRLKKKCPRCMDCIPVCPTGALR